MCHDETFSSGSDTKKVLDKDTGMSFLFKLFKTFIS